MYLTLRSVPELRDLPAKERRQLWSEAMRDTVRAKDPLIILISIATAIAVISALHAVKVLQNLWWLDLLLFAVGWTIQDRFVFNLWAIRLRPTFLAILAKRKAEGILNTNTKACAIVVTGYVLFWAVILPAMSISGFVDVDTAWRNGTSTPGQWVLATLFFLTVVCGYLISAKELYRHRHTW